MSDAAKCGKLLLLDDDFEDDRERARVRRVVEHVGVSGVGVFAARDGRIRLTSSDHRALPTAVKSVAAAWDAHALGNLPARSPTGALASLGSTCVAVCVDGVHVLAAPVGDEDLLVVLVEHGPPGAEVRLRLQRAAELLERFSLGHSRPGPSGGGAGPATAAVHAADGARPRK